MFLPFDLLVEHRISNVSVETCPLNYKSGETEELYGKLVRTWTMENGTYDDVYEFSANEYVGDSESCPTVDYSTTADPEIDYGFGISNSDVWTLPLTRGDVRDHLDTPDWGDWGYLIEFVTVDTYDAADVHALLDIGYEAAGSSQRTSEAVSSFDGFAKIYANRSDIEWRFSLRVPVACTLVYQIGSRAIDDPGDYVFGDEVELIVSTTPQTLTCPVEDGSFKRLRIVRIIAHPWT